MHKVIAKYYAITITQLAAALQLMGTGVCGWVVWPVGGAIDGGMASTWYRLHLKPIHRTDAKRLVSADTDTRS